VCPTATSCAYRMAQFCMRDANNSAWTSQCVVPSQHRCHASPARCTLVDHSCAAACALSPGRYSRLRKPDMTMPDQLVNLILRFDGYIEVVPAAGSSDSAACILGQVSSPCLPQSYPADLAHLSAWCSFVVRS
jgi:hypothetical protein